MWPSQVWHSLPGLTQQEPAQAIVQDLAAQQVAGRSRIAGFFEETPVGAKFVGIVGMYTGERKGGRGAEGESPGQQFNKDI